MLKNQCGALVGKAVKAGAAAAAMPAGAGGGSRKRKIPMPPASVADERRKRITAAVAFRGGLTGFYSTSGLEAYGSERVAVNYHVGLMRKYAGIDPVREYREYTPKRCKELASHLSFPKPIMVSLDVAPPTSLACHTTNTHFRVIVASQF